MADTTQTTALKLILGLDIGTATIGWCLRYEHPEDAVPLRRDALAKNCEEDADMQAATTLHTQIIAMGTHLVPMDTDVQQGFEKGVLGAVAGKGVTLTPAATRRGFRSMRRNLQRWKQRRDKLTRRLKDVGMMPDAYLLLALTPLELYGLRAKGVAEQLTLEELGRVLLHINQRRGFKSSRKSDAAEEGDAKETAYKAKMNDLHREMQAQNLTVGAYFYQQLSENPHYRVRDRVLMRQDMMKEFDRIWNTQAVHYPEILTEPLRKYLRDECIFKQRPLKSAKHLVGICTFEHQEIPDLKDPTKMRTVGKPCAAVSHPLAQEFRMWQTLNNIKLTDTLTGEQTFLAVVQKVWRSR